MITRSRTRIIALGMCLLLLAGACGSDSSSATADDATDTGDETQATESDADASSDDDTDSGSDTAPDGDNAAVAGAVDVGLFFDGALAEGATIEDCTLSGGVETTCYSITVAGYPASHDIGPFCPDTITDTEGGLWWDGDAIYDLSGEFVASLADIYGDDNWQMYDEDGNVFVTETAEEFEAAARPDVDPDLMNHCVQGMLEWLENGEPITTTVMIPVEPVAADAAAAPQGNQGVTLDGVVIANAAPVDAILGAYTIAAFDDCGAHFNPFDGYHMHGAVGCSEIEATSDGDPAQFGYAMDGYPLHSPFADDAAAEAAGLDECNGHTTEASGYHYHANSAEENQVVECLIGQTVAAAGGGDAGGALPDGERPDGPPPADGEG